MAKNIVLLLDAVTQGSIQEGVTEFLANKIEIANSLQEVPSRGDTENKSVIIFEGYLLSTGSINELILYKELYNLKYYFISSSEIFLHVMTDIAECRKMCISSFNYLQLQAIIEEDKGAIEKFSLKQEQLESSVLSLKNDLANQDLLTEETHALIDSLLIVLHSLDAKDKHVQALKNTLLKTSRECTTLKEQLQGLYSEFNHLAEAEYNRNKSLLQYEAILTQDIYSKVLLTNFPNRPIILYFKQYTKINQFDLFISTLREAFRIQRSLRCKCIKLYDSSNSIELALQPNHFKVIQNSYKSTDIEVNDFLVKYGDYLNVLDILLRNKMQVEVLLVFDCKSHNDMVMSGCEFTLEMCQCQEDADKLGLDKDLVISNNSQSKLSWNPSKEKLVKLDENDSFLYLTSQPAIKSILRSFDYLIES